MRQRSRKSIHLFAWTETDRSRGQAGHKQRPQKCYMNLKASSWASNRYVYTYITWLEDSRLPYWLVERNIKTYLRALYNRADLSLSETIESTNFGYTIMGNDDSRGLLNTVLYSSLENDRKGQRPRHRVRRHARPGCGRKHNTDGLGEAPPLNILKRCWVYWKIMFNTTLIANQIP